MPDFRGDIRRFLSPFALEATREAEIAEELSQHLQDRYEEMLGSGVNEGDAARAIADEIHGGTFAAEWRSVVERHRPPAVLGEPTGTRWFGGVGKDLRYAARQFRLSPGFALVAILSLALGIGANTAIFQLLDAVRLRSLPVRDPHQLAEVKVEHEGRSGTSYSFTNELSYPQWEAIRGAQQGFASLAAWGSTYFNINPRGEARYVHGMWVSGNFFEVLGVRAAVGRLLTAEDDQPGCGSPGAVLGYEFWQSEYGGEASVLQKSVMVQGHPLPIIGVTQPDFFGPAVGRRFEIAVPLCAEALIDPPPHNLHESTFWFLDTIGRLKPGWTVERASAQIAAAGPAILQSTLPTTYDAVDRENYLKFRFQVVSAATGESPLRRRYQSPLVLLLGISGLVLLIACVNIANLLMTRADVRQREMAIRLALGAGRARLLRQLLTEALLLAVAGALSGALLAQALSRFLVSLLSTQDDQVFLNLQPDGLVLGFTAALAILTCVLFGLLPALQASRTAPAAAMRAGGRGTTSGRSQFAVRRGLMVAQAAVSLVLLAAALLFVRTLKNLNQVNPGFDPSHVVVVDLTSNVSEAQRAAYQQQLVARVRTIPGVLEASTADVVPISGNGWNGDISIPGTATQRRISDLNAVGPGYFATLGIPVLTGRDFNDTDTATSQSVAVVNATFSRNFFGAANPIGRTFQLLHGPSNDALQYQVVGLVGDTKYLNLREEPPPIAYFAMQQPHEHDSDISLLLRSQGRPSDIIPSVRGALSQFDPNSVLQFTIFEKHISETLLRERLMATLAGFFGGLAVLLAVIGLYGVISYMVVRRRNEIGVHMALGATPGRILKMVVGEAGVLLAIGVAIGLALSLVAAPAARALLFGLQPTDPLTLAVAAFGLAVVAVLASIFPARRAAALDPMVALRDE